jgi:hypothetical protein
MPITTRCTACKKSFSAPDGSTGRVTECPSCGKSTVIGKHEPAKAKQSPAQFIAETVDTVYVMALVVASLLWIAPAVLAGFSLSAQGVLVGLAILVITSPLFIASVFMLKLWSSSILLFCDMANDLRTIAKNTSH